MRRTQATWMAAITTGIMACTAPASACPEPVEWVTDGVRADASTVARRVVVSIPDRKLALIDGDQVVGIYPVAVGAPVSPSPFAKSHGCIRLRNQDVEQLFEQLRAGDVVELHDERTPEILQLFRR